jgi:demethylmenaquinone methyltransferase/2-methoxy-6-polyprenyl-1,4-benzoquinol methylase
VRNFENLVKGLAEMHRVMQPGATLVVLEFSKPSKTWFKGLYNFYMKLVAPGFVQALSKHKKAYQYLNNSVQAFPEGPHFLKIMHEVGFTQTNLKTLSLGICTIYTGQKPVV